MLNSLVKDNIKSLLSYKVEEHADMIKLDANENNNASYLLNEKLVEAIMELKINEYPDSDCVELRAMLAEEFDLDIEQIMVGCGSDQLIALIMDTFIGSGDKMLTHVPTFGMYKIGTQIAGGITVEVPLNEDFSFDLDGFVEAMEREEPKVIFLTNPNNPTGNIMSAEQIIKIAQLSKGVVVVDEAYYEFYGESVIDLVNEYENLIVLRTFSKAYGLAGARVGYGVASKQLMDILYKVKPPYNVASLSQIAAKVCLMNKDIMYNTVREIVKEREKMINSLKEILGFRIFESHANFVLCKIGDSEGAG
ncbi:MAG: histidinol-phosphate transaminase, partial [Alkaliphilus sp.]|nr:histidinol-phosphate transaminase [Alkaliphilus sp.]